jgi:hypothetical protein
MVDKVCGVCTRRISYTAYNRTVHLVERARDKQREQERAGEREREKHNVLDECINRLGVVYLYGKFSMMSCTARLTTGQFSDDSIDSIRGRNNDGPNTIAYHDTNQQPEQEAANSALVSHLHLTYQGCLHTRLLAPIILTALWLATLARNLTRYYKQVNISCSLSLSCSLSCSLSNNTNMSTS